MRITQFQVFNYRSIKDSGAIEVGDLTAFVGQNEAGKSNLFSALYRVNPFDKQASYNLDEDWPIDDWAAKDAGARVCEARFRLDESDIASLVDCFGDAEEGEEAPHLDVSDEIYLIASSFYGDTFEYQIATSDGATLDVGEIDDWAVERMPKFVYIHDYEMSGHQTELDHLAQRQKTVAWDNLTPDEQSILNVLNLAKVDLEEITEKGSTAEGRTTRAFDTKQASAYLSKQFQQLWSQKAVRFEISIDHTTLNIFVEDEVVGMPVRLSNRSTGFRWYVSFAWKFTSASQGEFRDCILLLEEPGIHLHYSAQRDLLEVFDELKVSNSLLYTTHLASMVDLSAPERVRIVENEGGHTSVKRGVVSSQSGPMAVIEMSLGLSGGMSGLLGTRKTLIVEGGDDALILQKLSGVLKASDKPGLSDSIYLWPAKGASKTPMYAAFAIGQGWKSGVLLDSDKAGKEAKKKIQELHLSGLARANGDNFKVLMLNDASGVSKTDVAIEDLFPDEFYLDLVNRAYRVDIKIDDLPVDGSDMITKRVEAVLQSRYGRSQLDKYLVSSELLREFEGWSTAEDLPESTAEAAEKLFTKINAALDSDGD